MENTGCLTRLKIGDGQLQIVFFILLGIPCFAANNRSTYLSILSLQLLLLSHLSPLTHILEQFPILGDEWLDLETSGISKFNINCKKQCSMGWLAVFDHFKAQTTTGLLRLNMMVRDLLIKL